MFSNKIVTFVAIYPKQLFVVRCPSFLFSKLVRRLVEPSGYIDCEKCLALKLFFLFYFLLLFLCSCNNNTLEGGVVNNKQQNRYTRFTH